MARSKPKHKVNTENPKLPSEEKSKDGFFDLEVSFSFKKYDAQMPWARSVARKPIVDDVFQNLRGYEGIKWNCVLSASGGRSHGTNNHYVHLNRLLSAARQRINELKIPESELFSLRIQGDVSS